MRLLQIPPSCIRIGESDDVERGELVAEEIINRCSMFRSRIDLSLLYGNPKMLLYMFEFKKRLDTPEMLRQAVEQTVCYMLGPLAYSRWGRWGKQEPIVALILCFNSVYRLTLS